MARSDRDELLGLITRIGELAPDFRLGQLIALLTDRTETPYTASPIADIEDVELLAAAREFEGVLEARQPTDGDPSASTLRDRMQWMVGAVSDLPADFSAEHDHYIHGTLRRNSTPTAP